MAEKNNANIGFEEQLWKAACVLWGHIPAAEYRKVIVGLIFLRYISSVFDKRYQELLAEGDGFENDPIAYLAENIFFVPEENREEAEKYLNKMNTKMKIVYVSTLNEAINYLRGI